MGCGGRILGEARPKRIFEISTISGRIRRPETGAGALHSPPSPHSPIGRGSGLKIRPVSVRVRLGAPQPVSAATPGLSISDARVPASRTCGASCQRARFDTKAVESPAHRNHNRLEDVGNNTPQAHGQLSGMTDADGCHRGRASTRTVKIFDSTVQMSATQGF